jgi:hypothetical protein
MSQSSRRMNEWKEWMNEWKKGMNEWINEKKRRKEGCPIASLFNSERRVKKSFISSMSTWSIRLAKHRHSHKSNMMWRWFFAFVWICMCLKHEWNWQERKKNYIYNHHLKTILKRRISWQVVRFRWQVLILLFAFLTSFYYDNLMYRIIFMKRLIKSLVNYFFNIILTIHAV